VLNCCDGVGEELGQRLLDKGFGDAYVVLEKFLVFDKREELFKKWLHEVSGANAHEQNHCCQCVKEWCDAFL